MAYKKYKAVNAITGEVLEGKAEDLADRMGVTVKGFYNAELCQMKVKGEWEIEKMENPEKNNCRNYLRELLEMWDSVVGELKRSGCDLRIPIAPVARETRPSKAIM